MLKAAIIIWVVASLSAIAQEDTTPLCSIKDVADRAHLLPDIVAFDPGGAAQAYSEALGCSLVLTEGMTRGLDQSASASSLKPIVQVDAETLDLIEVLGPSPETDSFARGIDDEVFHSVAALSDRRAVLFLSNPSGAQILIDGRSYGTTGQDMGIRDGFLQTARMVLPGYIDCSYSDALVDRSETGRETVVCEMQPTN